MTVDEMIDIVLRWAHLLGAITLVGGIIYQWFVARPAEPGVPATGADSTAREFQRRRWSILVMIGTSLLLISGLVNTALVSMRFEFTGGLYHALLAVKLVLALVVFFLASVLTGRSALAERLRASRKPWMTWLVVLSVLTVAVAAIMKNIDRVPKNGGESRAVESDSTAEQD